MTFLRLNFLISKKESCCMHLGGEELNVIYTYI